MEKTYDPRIAEARRLARRMAREQGTPYQSALDTIARGAGAASWSEFVQTPTAIPNPTMAAPADVPDAGDNEAKSMTADDKDLLIRVAAGVLGTTLTVVLGTGLLIGSTFAIGPWATAIETMGTLLCAAGILVIPSAQSGYVMGIGIGNIRHVMQIRWRLAMALAQGWFILGVARHLIMG